MSDNEGGGGGTFTFKKSFRRAQNTRQRDEGPAKQSDDSCKQQILKN